MSIRMMSDIKDSLYLTGWINNKYAFPVNSYSESIEYRNQLPIFSTDWERIGSALVAHWEVVTLIV